MAINLELLGGRIKAARSRAHLNQKQFAELVGLSVNHCGNLERGVRMPKFATLAKICEVTSTPMDEMVKDVVMPEGLHEQPLQLGELSKADRDYYTSCFAAMIQDESRRYVEKSLEIMRILKKVNQP